MVGICQCHIPTPIHYDIFPPGGNMTGGNLLGNHDDHRNTVCFWIADGGGFWGEARVDEDPMGGEGRPGGRELRRGKIENWNSF